MKRLLHVRRLKVRPFPCALQFLVDLVVLTLALAFSFLPSLSLSLFSLSRSPQDVYTGGLGSYTLTLMVIFFLRKSCGALTKSRRGGSRLMSARKGSMDGSECSDTMSVTSASWPCLQSPSTSPKSPAQSSTPHGCPPSPGTAVDKLEQLPSPALKPVAEDAMRALRGSSSDELDVPVLSLHRIKMQQKMQQMAPGARSPSCSSVTSVQSTDSIASSLLSSSSARGRRSARQRRSCELGKLLCEFCHFFGNFDATSTGISVQEGRVHSFPHSGHFPLVVEDPFQPGVNVACGSFTFWHVQETFRNAALLLGQSGSTAQTLFALLNLFPQANTQIPRPAGNGTDHTPL